MNRRHFFIHSLYLTIAFSGLNLTACSSNKPDLQTIPAGSRVVAVGDSLTYGYGAPPDSAYPKVLSDLTGWHVVNAGINGDTSAGVLARSDAIVASQPKLVLLGVGGNDVLRRIDPATTASNITTTIQKFKSADIPVVLIAEPYFSTSALFGRASDNPIYADIAAKESVPLFSRSDGGWSVILSDNALKSDQIHANAQGYREFAKNLYGYLMKQGFIVSR